MSEFTISKKQTALYISFQLIGWTCYASVLILAMNLQGEITKNRVIFVVSSAITGLVVTHLMRFIYLKSRIFEKKIAPLIYTALLLDLACAFVFELISICVSLFLEGIGSKMSVGDVVGDVVSLFVILLIWTIIYFANHFIRKSRVEEVKNIQLISANNEIELSHLRTQLNPHFLFNAMNSIRALINIDPELAKESITKLSSILRNSLLFGKDKFITIEEECNFIDDYLSLEKIRFEERLNVIWVLGKDVKEVLIPPLIIQSQIENAIKHGISNLIKGGNIEIKVNKLNNMLTIEVKNTGKLNDSKHKNSAGIGLANLERRLKIIYDDRAKYNLFEEQGMVVSRIKIDLK